MSDTTITNIPSALETRVKEPSDGAQVPPTGPGSSDRFKYLRLLIYFSVSFNNNIFHIKTRINTNYLKVEC